MLNIFEVEGRVPLGTPNETWDEVLKKDLRNKGLDRLVICTYIING